MHFLYHVKKQNKKIPITQRKLHRQTSSTLNTCNSDQGGLYESRSKHDHDKVLSEETFDCENTG